MPAEGPVCVTGWKGLGQYLGADGSFGVEIEPTTIRMVADGASVRLALYVTPARTVAIVVGSGLTVFTALLGGVIWLIAERSGALPSRHTVLLAIALGACFVAFVTVVSALSAGSINVAAQGLPNLLILDRGRRRLNLPRFDIDCSLDLVERLELIRFRIRFRSGSSLPTRQMVILLKGDGGRCLRIPVAQGSGIGRRTAQRLAAAMEKPLACSRVRAIRMQDWCARSVTESQVKADLLCMMPPVPVGQPGLAGPRPTE